MKRLTVRMPDALYAALEQYARQEHRKVSPQIVAALEALVREAGLFPPPETREGTRRHAPTRHSPVAS